ncbi:MAG: hypothetical protein CM1200mP3_10860 [Chloroflexota bacterium]|nr:MAG: hypothetical protein CM1200mP3_10860 [Chloroflexota bacterium]
MTGLGSNGAAEIPDARRIQIEISKECSLVVSPELQIENIKGVRLIYGPGLRRRYFEELDNKFMPTPDAGTGNLLWLRT